MKRFLFIPVMIVIGIIFFMPFAALSYTIESRYAKITYESTRDLREFNNELYMGRLKSQVQRSDTIEEEVAAKINFIVEKVMAVLDMFPPKFQFEIFIYPDERGVQAAFKQIYNIKVDYIAFYSPKINTVFYSSDNANLRVVAHEIGHVVVETYFTISPPQRIHEVMAQFAEQHVTD